MSTCTAACAWANLSICSVELRFCDCEETVTAHGDYRWVETTGGTNVSVECNLGPAEGFSVEEARAMRRCGENGEWEEERLSQCITQVTLDLQALSEVRYS